MRTQAAIGDRARAIRAAYASCGAPSRGQRYATEQTWRRLGDEPQIRACVEVLVVDADTMRVTEGIGLLDLTTNTWHPN